MKNENLLSLSYGRIVNKDINSLDGLLPASFETYQVVHPGDIVFRLTDLQNDKRSLRSAIVRDTGIITSAYLAVACRGIFPEFANFLFRAYDSIKVFYSMGGGLRQSMKYSDMKWLPILLPDWQEQTHIARFLDHEIARIDALIEEQQRLIELLKEKRQAVISRAVTKGLDPTVPMKDSGVEWLGEVPAHWDVVRVKHIKSWRPNAFVDGPFGSNLKSEHFVDDGDVYVIESSFATTGELNFGDLKQVTLEHFETIKRSEVCAGDIVIAKIGARYGMCSILPWLDKPAVVSGNSLKLTVNERICDPKFAVLVLQHLKERGAIEDIVNMTAQPALSLGEMNNLPFPLPSLGEQLDIVSELEKELGEFEALTSECKQVMNLAIERRSALISAAVTGKIDVRGWQPPVSTQAPKFEVAEAN